jgi:hypothetical protein
MLPRVATNAAALAGGAIALSAMLNVPRHGGRGVS